MGKTAQGKTIDTKAKGNHVLIYQLGNCTCVGMGRVLKSGGKYGENAHTYIITIWRRYWKMHRNLSF